MHQSLQPNHLQARSTKHFTPTVLDIKLLWTKCYYPTESWQEISEILRSKFSIDKNPHVLKHRYEHYLNIPAIVKLNRQEAEKNRNHPFLVAEGRKNPEEFLQLYRQIKQYHEKTTANKREQTYQKQIIKRQLYPNFQNSLVSFQNEASKYLKVQNIAEEYELLRLKETQELTEDEAVKLQKIQKIYFKSKQMRLENQKKISKLHRIIRNIISAESRCFAEDILINQMNIGKFLIKVLKNVFHNCGKVARKIIQQEQKEGRTYSRYNYNEDRTQTPNKQFAKLRASESGLSEALLLEDFSNVERFYSEASDPLYRKDIIKLYYFPPNQKQDRSSLKAHQNISDTHSDAFPTPDGQTLTMKRLVLILKMFKKIDLMYIKKNQKAEYDIKMEIESVQQRKGWKVSQDSSRQGMAEFQSPFDAEDKRHGRTISPKSLGSFRHSSPEKIYQLYRPQQNKLETQNAKPSPKRYLSSSNPMVITIPNPDHHLQRMKERERYLRLKKAHRQGLKSKVKNATHRSKYKDEDGLQIIEQDEYYNDTEKNQGCNFSQLSQKTQKRQDPKFNREAADLEENKGNTFHWDYNDASQMTKRQDWLFQSTKPEQFTPKRNRDRIKDRKPQYRQSSQEVSPFQLEKTPDRPKPPQPTFSQPKRPVDFEPFESPFDMLERQKKENKAKSKVIKKGSEEVKVKKERAKKNTAKRGRKYQLRREEHEQGESDPQGQKQHSLIDALTEPLEPLPAFKSRPMTLDQAIPPHAAPQDSRDYILGMLKDQITGKMLQQSQLHPRKN